MPETAESPSQFVSHTDAPACGWFAVYTATHHEKSVHELLTQRQVESFLPSYKATRRWAKRPPVTLELPLFPNYVFVRMQREQRTTVLGTQGVFTIVGSGKQAWELPQHEIEALRIGVKERKVEPHPYLKVGERARVTAGVLAGLEGIIVRRKSNLHIVLNLDQIMQSVAIEVEASELEPIVLRPRPATAQQPQGGWRLQPLQKLA